jgi:hypothetical protein
MGKNKAEKLPQFASIDDLVDFFDTHDLGDYWDQMPEVAFDIDLQQTTHLFALDADLSDKLTKIAKTKHVPAEVLINTWLREKILEPS